MEDYFSFELVYNDRNFLRRFRLSQDRYTKIIITVEAHNSYKIQKKDCCGVLRLGTRHKVAAAMRILAYGYSSHAADKYLRLRSSTVNLCVQKILRTVIDIFEGEYLRKPTEEVLKAILYSSADRGFPGMLGCLKCGKWVWKKCPTSWHAQFEGT
ncbi:hypothetical protein BWQ96_07500 [Gracilariopsis chorda]|uniref:Nuclease HARBI1 n=1 Tax=Gracilariopsis chorda TaxID=448386 RepID=A0A2V3IL56_9FLOR|nr:hypothetical protein BWQ96_07500 [Gracilariopsis chorda]|eukprot:PXF42793.1 hypothetical protein BWQ96_07500 [Gracilariopsis chorda]